MLNHLSSLVLPFFDQAQCLRYAHPEEYNTVSSVSCACRLVSAASGPAGLPLLPPSVFLAIFFGNGRKLAVRKHEIPKIEYPPPVKTPEPENSSYCIPGLG